MKAHVFPASPHLCWRLRPLACTAILALATAPLAGQSLPLIPTPRQVQPGASQPIPQGLRIACQSCASDPDDAFTRQDLEATLTARGIPSTGPFTLQLTRSASLPVEMTAEGYTITPGPNSLTLAASSAAGLFYAAQTAKQLIQGDGPAAMLHLATIRDWPAMKYRGLHDDLSRGPVPTLAFQKQLIQTLAAYKANIYSPYFEHTQQYTSNPLPAPPGGSLSPADARELTAFAARYHVTIIPEQEAFGHLHHNLTWEFYQPLAETPHGAVLAPGQPGSLTLIQQMFTELAADYPGPFLHIGADETADLGLGQTKPDVETRGLGPVYLDFLERIDTALAPLHRKLLFWGDIAQSIVQRSTAYSANAGASSPDRLDPDILRNVPAVFKQNTIAVAWWYTPNPSGGFAKFLTPFTSAGFETWVAPGINNWSVVYPDYNDGLTNIQQFVAEGQRQHSTGVLNTIWNDDGESLSQQQLVRHPLRSRSRLAARSVSPIEPFEQSFAQVFHGDLTGDLNQAQLALMQAHTLLRQAKIGDGSDGLFWMDPWSKDGQAIAARFRPTIREERLAAERALTLIAKARAAYPAPLLRQLRPGAPGHRVFCDDLGCPLRLSTPPTPLPSNPTTLRYPDAIDALELGARRLDLIGLKFELTDEIVAGYNRALTAQSSPDRKLHSTVSKELSDIRGVNGRLEDIRDTYALLRDLYEQTWLRSNRAYALRPVLEHYDATIQLWQARSDRFRTAARQYGETRLLPSPADLGLPSGH